MFLGSSPTSENDVYKAVNILWLFAGLAWLSTVVTTIQQFIQLFISINEHKISTQAESTLVSVYFFAD